MSRDSIWSFLRANSLFLSLLVGVMIGLLEIEGWWTWHVPCGTLPLCIFLMLFFTFLRMDPMTLRLHRWHGVILAFQLVVSMVLFYLLRGVDVVLAQGLFICVLMPSATAAPIIAEKLGGNNLNLTAYTLLSNGLTAIIVPLLFPLVNTRADMPFWSSFLLILHHIAPMLLGPFFSAWVLRLVIKTVRHREPELRGWLKDLPFWLWVLTLVVLMAQMTVSLSHYDGSLVVLGGVFAGSLITCLAQFYFGKWSGYHLPVFSCDETKVTAGQALGQKNTTLGVWLAATYLNPVSALAPAAYIIWQNLFNSWQLSQTVRKNRKK